jgi:peptidyl-tRNA hydrolase
MWHFSASHFFFNIPPVDAKPAEVVLKEDFEDTKGAIRFRITKKNRQHNGLKNKTTNNDLQNTTHKTKDRVHLVFWGLKSTNHFVDQL